MFGSIAFVFCMIMSLLLFLFWKYSSENMLCIYIENLCSEFWPCRTLLNWRISSWIPSICCCPSEPFNVMIQNNTATSWTLSWSRYILICSIFSWYNNQFILKWKIHWLWLSIVCNCDFNALNIIAKFELHPLQHFRHRTKATQNPLF